MYIALYSTSSLQAKEEITGIRRFRRKTEEIKLNGFLASDNQYSKPLLRSPHLNEGC